MLLEARRKVSAAELEGEVWGNRIWVARLHFPSQGQEQTKKECELQCFCNFWVELWIRIPMDPFRMKLSF